MQINKANIDEHLFEYFEGMMNPQQADDLMAFIHKNPEYETDLVQWRKTYHHKAHELEDYGIAAPLKKPVPQAVPLKALYLLGVLSIGIVFGWFLNQYSNHTTAPKQIEVQTQTPQTLDTIQASLPHGPRLGRRILDKTHTGEPSAVKSDTVAVQHDTLYNVTQTFVPQMQNLDTVVSLPAVEPKLAKTDTVASPKATPVSPDAKAKKKVRRKGVFYTTDKILPPNDNF